MSAGAASLPGHGPAELQPNLLCLHVQSGLISINCGNAMQLLALLHRNNQIITLTLSQRGACWSGHMLWRMKLWKQSVALSVIIYYMNISEPHQCCSSCTAAMVIVGNWNSLSTFCPVEISWSSVSPLDKYLDLRTFPGAGVGWLFPQWSWEFE